MKKNKGKDSKELSQIEKWRLTATKEEQSKAAAKGGIASGVTRNKQKTMRETLKQVLSLPVLDKEKAAELKEAGLDPDIISAICKAQADKAMDGDTEAARYIRDTTGEKPREALDISQKPLQAKDMTDVSDSDLEAVAD